MDMGRSEVFAVAYCHCGYRGVGAEKALTTTTTAVRTILASATGVEGLSYFQAIRQISCRGDQCFQVVGRKKRAMSGLATRFHLRCFDRTPAGGMQSLGRFPRCQAVLNRSVGNGSYGRQQQTEKQNSPR